MSLITVPFGKLLPDQAAFNSSGVVAALNVVPQTGSYGPLKTLEQVSSALGALCLGAISARDKDNNVYVYAGTASKIYELVAGTFTDQSVGGGYSTAASDGWEFVVWDKSSKIIGTNFTDPVQSMAIGGGASGAFANLITGTNKPKAKHIAVIGQFLMLGNTNDAVDGQKPTRVWWSANGNELNLDPDASTQSDFEDLASGGWVQKIVGGNDYGLIFQTDMVRTARYVGGGLVFELLPINYAPGTPISNSVVTYKGATFYISEAGFMSIAGGQVTPIGTAQIDRYFWDQFDVNNKLAVSTAIDPVRKLVCWGFPGSGSSSALPNKVLAFKWDEGKWAEWDLDHELLFRSETQGYTLDSLDTLGTNIDDSSIFNQSLDSDKWKGGTLRFGAFDQTHKLAFFTGANRAGSITTGDLQPKNGSCWQSNSVRPLIDGGGVEVSIARRQRLIDAVSFLPSSSINVDGLCSVRAEGRYQRFRSSITSSMSWSHFQGLELDFEFTGSR